MTPFSSPLFVNFYFPIIHDSSLFSCDPSPPPPSPTPPSLSSPLPPPSPSLCPPSGWAGVELLLVLCGLDASLPCPHHCICYTSPSTVSCQAHNFHAVPEGIPAQSERVFLQNNKIQRLLRGHFSPTTAMLWLYSNNITYIQASTFHGFDRLEELDLGDNRHLRALAPDTFQGLGRLHALHLYHCGLLTLPGGIFAGLNNLQYLYLQVGGASASSTRGGLRNPFS